MAVLHDSLRRRVLLSRNSIRISLSAAGTGTRDRDLRGFGPHLQSCPRCETVVLRMSWAPRHRTRLFATLDVLPRRDWEGTRGLSQTGKKVGTRVIGDSRSSCRPGRFDGHAPQGNVRVWRQKVLDGQHGRIEGIVSPVPTDARLRLHSRDPGRSPQAITRLAWFLAKPQCGRNTSRTAGDHGCFSDSWRR